MTAPIIKIRQNFKILNICSEEEVGEESGLKLGHRFYGPAFPKICNSMGTWFNIYKINIVEVVENYFWTVHYKTTKWCINEKVGLSSFPLKTLCSSAQNVRLHMLSLVHHLCSPRCLGAHILQRPENLKGP